MVNFLKLYSWAEGVEKRELFYTVGGNVVWCSLDILENRMEIP